MDRLPQRHRPQGRTASLIGDVSYFIVFCCLDYTFVVILFSPRYSTIKHVFILLKSFNPQQNCITLLSLCFDLERVSSILNP